MIPEAEGTRPWGPSRKRALECLKSPKTTYTIIAITEKQFKRNKKGPFSLYIGSPRSHTGNGISGARRGRSLPVPPPPPVSPAMTLAPLSLRPSHQYSVAARFSTSKTPKMNEDFYNLGMFWMPEEREFGG